MKYTKSNIKGISTLAIAICLFLASYSLSVAQHVSPKGNSLRKTSINDDYNFFDVNNIRMWLSNNGDMSFDPYNSAAGLEWPKGSGKHVVYEDGIVIGGIIDSNIHVAGSTFRHGFQAGKILPGGTADNPDDSRYRVYKATRMTGQEFSQLDNDQQEILKRDFLEWPVVDGAPFFDANGNGIYDPDFDAWLKDNSSSDSPLYVGDQVLWYIANDLDEERSRRLYGSRSVGLEVQTLVWGYDVPKNNPLRHMVFTRFLIINKGKKALKKCYISRWSDSDLGDAWDDYVGVDTINSLGYTYNADSFDSEYGNPPAVGYVLLQGPIVSEPGSTAYFNFGLKRDARNLPLGSFNWVAKSMPPWGEPSLGFGYRDMYNLQTGHRMDGSPYIDPLTGDSTLFCFAGDPITRRGWTQDYTSSPHDVRLMMNCGPFTLAVGDTQEVVYATLVGKGLSNLHSIEVLRYFSGVARGMLDSYYQYRIQLPLPHLKAVSFPDKIVLHWGDPKSVETVEKHDRFGYSFQGYKLFQLKSPNQPLSEATQIVTFDKADSVSIVVEWSWNEATGGFENKQIMIGNNNGIRHSHEITRDSIRREFLVRHRNYYFALTWFAYNPDLSRYPRVIESEPAIITVQPQRPNPGTRFGMEYLEQVTVRHISGKSTGEITVQVIDPSRLTGHTYEVSFQSAGKVESPYDRDGNGTPDEVLVLDDYRLWSLRDSSADSELITRADLINAVEGHYIVDGFMIDVQGSGYYKQDTDDPKEVKTVEWIGGKNPFEPWWYNWFLPGWWFFGSSIKGYDITQTVEIRFDRNRKSKGYSYPRHGNYGYSYKGYYESPITVWDVSDPDNPRQISYAFSEQSGGPFDNDEWMPGNSLGDREYLYILNIPYDDTPKPTLTRLNIQRNGDRFPVLYAGWFQRKTSSRQTDPAGEKTSQDYPWQDGAVWRIVPNVPFSDRDQYTFTTVAPVTKDVTIARKDIERINVFPNPYMAKNDWETTKYERFVTFTHLPERATIRVFTLTGTLVRTIMKDDPSQTIRWDLKNANGYPVGAGIYIIHVDMPELGTTKVLKLAVVREVQILDRL